MLGGCTATSCHNLCAQGDGGGGVTGLPTWLMLPCWTLIVAIVVNGVIAYCVRGLPGCLPLEVSIQPAHVCGAICMVNSTCTYVCMLFMDVCVLCVYVCICVCVCVCVLCVYVCICVCACICVCVMCECMCVHACMCECMCVHVCVCECMCVEVCVCACVCVCVSACVHVCGGVCMACVWRCVWVHVCVHVCGGVLLGLSFLLKHVWCVFHVDIWSVV